MQTNYTLEDWDKKINPAINKLIDDDLLRYSIQIFEKTNNNFKPFGSGVLLTTHDYYFLLTASHVLDYLTTKENQLYVRVGFNRFINIRGIINFTNYKENKQVDLGYIRLDPEMIDHFGTAYKFLTIDKVSKHQPKLGGSNYCALGFPAKNFKYENNSIKTGASFYLTNAANTKPYKYYGLNPAMTIVINMKGKGEDLLNDKKESIDSRFWGLSGGGLWYLTYHQDPESKEFSIDYRLIAILTEFRKDKYFCLIANKIHLIVEAFINIEGFRFNAKPKQYYR